MLRMLRRLFFPLHLIEETVHPFHRVVAALTYVATLSFTTVLTSYFEPVKVVWFSFLLTFPLTTGLTIVMLILYHVKWDKLDLRHLFIGPALFALLFLTLSGFSSLIGLPDYAKNYMDSVAVEKQRLRIADSIIHPAPYIEEAKQRQRTLDSLFEIIHSGKVDYAAMKKAEEELGLKPGTLVNDVSPRPWYQLILLPFGFLYREFVDFYNFYGASRFWSGVVIALFFSYYIERMRRKITRSGPDVPGATRSESNVSGAIRSEGPPRDSPPPP